MEKLFLDNFFPKGKKDFQFWTFFLSIFENLKKLLKNTLFLSHCDHNVHKNIFGSEKSVTIIFLYFKEKNLDTFFC
jgi:hypothetical protein